MRALRPIGPDLIIAIIFFLLPLGFFSQQTLGGRTLVPTENLYQFEPYATYREVVQAPERPQNHLLSDLVLQNYQWKSFIREQLAIGEVPLWNPHQFSGIPFLAAGQHSALYPLSAIYYALDLPAAYGWFTVVNLWLSGLLMYCFVRALGIARGGAALAGVVYQFGGFVLASIVFQMIIAGLPWLPLMLLMTEYILRGRTFMGRPAAILWTALGAIALGLNVLAGHAEYTIYALLITGYYAALRLLWLLPQKARTGRTIRAAMWLLAMVALGMALGAIQFIPLFEFVQTNWRAERGDLATVLSYAHPPRDIVQFLIPNFYGSPAHHHYLDLFSGQIVEGFGGASGQTHSEWGIKNYVEGALYLGILPLLLAFYALAERWFTNRPGWTRVGGRTPEPPYRIIFSTLGFISLTFMFGLPTYGLLYALPGLNQLNSPFRWIYALTVCIAVLAAFGMDALLRRASGSRPSVPRNIGRIVVSLGGLILIALLASRIFYPQLEPFIESRILGDPNQPGSGMVNAAQAFGSASAFFSYQFGNIAVLGLMLLLGGLIFWHAPRPQSGRKAVIWASAAVTLTAIDLMIASWGFNPASDPALLDFTPPSVQYLQQKQAEEGHVRFTTYQDPKQRTLMNANTGWRHGLYDIRGYDSIIPRDYVDYMRGLSPQVQLDFNRIAPIYTDYNVDFDPQDALDSAALDRLNVRYIMTHKNTDIPGFELVYEDEAVRIYENPGAMPYAYILYEGGQGIEQLPVLSDTGREKLIAVAGDRPQRVVISENNAPGWRAYIRAPESGEENEQPLTVETWDAIYQSVVVPEGQWVLRMVYSPTSFQVGLFGSAIGAALLAFMVGAWLWRSMVGDARESSGAARVARNSIAPIALNLFNRGIDFVFAIVMYRLLDPASVGVYNFAVVVFVWFDIFTNFGLDLFLIREVARDKLRSGFFLFNTSYLRLWLSVIGLGLLMLFLLFWQSAVAEPLNIEGLAALVLLYAGLFPASLSKGVTSLFYAHEQAETPAAIATITTINKAVFGVIVLLLGWGIVGLAAVSIANNILTLGLLLWAGRGLIGRIERWKPDFTMLRGMTRESLPLMLNHFLATIFFQFDIVILQALRGSVVVAQYSTAYKWLLAINVVPAFFTQALFPVMSRQAQENRAALKRTYSLGLKLMIALSLPLAVMFTFLAEVLTLILAGPAYLPNGAIALQIMIWSIPFGWMNSLTQYALIAVDLQRAITWAFFGAVSFNLITNLIFIPVYGFQAAALTTIASEMVLLIPFGILMQRGLNARIDWIGIIWRPLLAAGAMFGLMALLWPLSPLLAVPLGPLLYVALLLGLRPFSMDEVGMLPGPLRPLARLGRPAGA